MFQVFAAFAQQLQYAHYDQTENVICSQVDHNKHGQKQTGVISLFDKVQNRCTIYDTKQVCLDQAVKLMTFAVGSLWII